ncbi:MAG TPA: valine--tRNA ligase [Candidatus Angelobacter sp.]|nr:valine--tRNA ligase [Candidatus Angelobacter sp.]
MAREIAKTYDPQQIEPRWAEYWVKEELFKADASAPGPVFSIVIPPPNVTGSLHIGHMLDHTEIDILTRWHRMRGYNTLYLPGMDHASISTQRVVARQLADQGVDYRKLGREEFLKRVWKWKEESGGIITRQMRQIGESCDWSREKFTFSPELSRVVIDVFVRLYEEGLIYRAHRLLNWCPVCLTVLSDLEVVHEDRPGHLWHIRYPVVGTNEYLVVATTRPETMLGDTAVAVHPEDERYQNLVGKRVLLPLMNREIPVIADAMVDREFGTGAVKITPAHDPNDFEVGKRHQLAEIDVMTDDARMNANAGAYAGLDRFEARKKIVEDLKAQGLLEKITEHTAAIGLCERSKTVVEPRISTQWFCKMKPLAEPAIAAVERGEIQIIPENRREEYFNWMRNIRDWTLSRQLWWGHRIPAWYCKEHSHVTVAREKPAHCATCNSANLEQDPDVLDTWFSSGLWPFATLGWPENTADYKTYYPTSLLITGYEILFLWVARMAMLGIHFTGKVPFRTVYLHSIVRTADGQKMSKSKGTGIDPIDVNRRYGTDAMRFTLAVTASVGDVIWTEDRIQSSRNFANKIWNAARFLFMNFEKYEEAGGKMEDVALPEVRDKAPYRWGDAIELVDLWIFSRLGKAIVQNNEALAGYRFQEAAQGVYHFFWGDLCDWYIEWVKPRLLDKNLARATAAWRNLFAIFERALRLLHPFMPFLTEELWQKLPQRAGIRSIALDSFPEARSNRIDPVAEKQFSLLQRVITSVRTARADNKLDPKKKIAAELSSKDVAVRELVEGNLESLQRLAALSSLRVTSDHLSGQGYFHSLPEGDVHIPFSEIADPHVEIGRLRKEIEGLRKAVGSKEQQLGNETFRSRAPEHIIKGLEMTLAEQRIELEKSRKRLEDLERGS